MILSLPLGPSGQPIASASLSHAQENVPSLVLPSVESAATKIASYQTEAAVALFDVEVLQLTDDLLKSAFSDVSFAKYIKFFDFNQTNGFRSERTVAMQRRLQAPPWRGFLAQRLCLARPRPAAGRRPR